MGSRASRDIGLLRIQKATRWMAAGAVVGAGLLSTAVAKALPGKASHPSSVTSSPNPPATGGAQPTQTLIPPQQVPQSVTNPPVVSSGGS